MSDTDAVKSGEANHSSGSGNSAGSMTSANRGRSRGAGAVAAAASLLHDLQRQVKKLEADLRERAEQQAEFRERFQTEYAAAQAADRTAVTYGAWLDGQVTQSAVAWVLSCVFLRFCEDNALIAWPYLAGPGDRLSLAEDRQDQFFKENPRKNDRDWIIEGFRALEAAAPAARGLFDERHNPLWALTPSFTAASELLAFWRQRNELGLEIRHSFYDPELDTRFLGDLYQDLSEAARKNFALLQTPEFVEEFILDLTLTPALEEFPLERTPDFRLIDPTCGSGHFLLGAFWRLLAQWRAVSPGEEDGELITRSLRAVNGVDKNPFAVAIARFRLLIAAMKAAGKRSFAELEQYDLPIRVAVADSLWHAGMQGRQEELAVGQQLALGEERPDGASELPFSYGYEDIYEPAYFGMLKKGSYHVVIGNPPYITVKDKAENEKYRDLFKTCSGQYALSVPFAQLFFELAMLPDDAGSLRRGGFVGQITANSFMKREFGKKLIEKFFATDVDLTHIVDTSGAYIPGHGTPTVILVGRNRTALRDGVIRAVLGVRGEPTQPDIPADGLVWQAIVSQVRRAGSGSEWVTVEDARRERFTSYPWSISGGGSGELTAAIEKDAERLTSRAASVGRTTASGADDVFLLPDKRTAVRLGEIEYTRRLVIGETVRDYAISAECFIRNPYMDSSNSKPLSNQSSLILHGLWPYRTLLSARQIFGTKIEENGYPWYVHLENYSSKLSVQPGLTFAFVATHNQFALDREGRLFNRTAPVIKLAAEASEDDHLALLGVLNSSTACFWLKQVCHSKGSQSGTGGFMHDEWEPFYEFTATKLEQFPLPATLPLEFGRKLDALAQQLSAQEPSALCTRTVPTREALNAARAEHENLRAQMIAWQEELDWETYRHYGLLTDDEAASVIARSVDLPNLRLGERAFEIILAGADTETQWFARHNSTPITEVPTHWPDTYRKVVEARIALIMKRPDLALIERPECKRRWATEPWEKKEREALRSWLLDRFEDRALWYSTADGMTVPRPLTVNKLADLLDTDPDVTSVAALYARDHLAKPSASLSRVLEEIIAEEHVPYLAALRYRPSGLRKRAEWEEVWRRQRKEDDTGVNQQIDVPQKYTSVDFSKQSYWRNRGKLDVPKERFISYPGASPDGDPTLLLGWAGWNHLEQAHALTLLLTDRIGQAGWAREQLTPLIAGLREQMPWVRQWHADDDPAWNGSPAGQLDAYLQQLRLDYELGDEALEGWRP